MKFPNSHKSEVGLSEAEKVKKAKEVKARAVEIWEKTQLSSIERKNKRNEPLKPWDKGFLEERADKKAGGPKPPTEGAEGRIFDGKPFDAGGEVTWPDLSRCSQVLVKMERDALEESASKSLLLARGPIAMNLTILSGEPVATCNETLHREMLAERDVLRDRLMGTETPEAAAQDFLKAEAEIRVIFGDAPLALTETERGKLLSLFEEYRKMDGRWYKFGENAARAKIAFPDLPLDITDTDMRSLNREVYKYAPGADEKVAMSNAPTFAYLTSCLTVLGRNNIDMTEYYWGIMRKAYQGAQKKLADDSNGRLSDRYSGSDGAKEAESFSQFAASLKIIAAGRVAVTDKGLEIQDKKVEELPKIEVVPATPEDAPAIHELLYKSWMETFADKKEGGITADDVEDLFKNTFTVGNLAGSLVGEETVRNFVAKEGNNIVGYCRFRERPGENFLSRMHVAPGRTGERIGTMLWEQVRAASNPDKPTALWVEIGNENAKAVYRKWGFVEANPPTLDEEKPMKSGAHRTMMKMILKAKKAPES